MPNLLLHCLVVVAVVCFATAQQTQETNKCQFCPANQNPVQVTAPPTSGNGCGSGATEPLVPEGRFENCCNQHDICYATCSKSKELCDRQFYACMQGVCSTQVDQNDQSEVTSCQERAVCYAGTVAFTDSACNVYNQRQSERCNCSANAAAQETVTNEPLIPTNNAGGIICASSARSLSPSSFLMLAALAIILRKHN